MTAAFLCASLGIVPTVRHADYIGSWLEVLRDDDRAIIRAASAASKAAEYLLAFQAGEDEPEVPAGLAIPASAHESQRAASVP
jgi:antirestriction protein ArdC